MNLGTTPNDHIKIWVTRPLEQVHHRRLVTKICASTKSNARTVSAVCSNTTTATRRNSSYVFKEHWIPKIPGRYRIACQLSLQRNPFTITTFTLFASETLDFGWDTSQIRIS